MSLVPLILACHKYADNPAPPRLSPARGSGHRASPARSAAASAAEAAARRPAPPPASPSGFSVLRSAAGSRQGLLNDTADGLPGGQAHRVAVDEERRRADESQAHRLVASRPHVWHRSIAFEALREGVGVQADLPRVGN